MDKIIDFAVNAFIVVQALSIPALIAADIYWGWSGNLAVWAIIPVIMFMAGI
jgi:hypothetical protein